MSYPAVEIKAWYDTRTDNMEIGFTFLNTVLKSIPEENLDIKGDYVKPNENVLQEIKDYFTKEVSKEKVKKEAHKMDPGDYGGIREFEIIVGMTYLNDEGTVDHHGHFTTYNIIGPSQRRIRKVFSKI